MAISWEAKFSSMFWGEQPLQHPQEVDCTPTSSPPWPYFPAPGGTSPLGMVVLTPAPYPHGLPSKPVHHRLAVVTFSACRS